MGFNLSCTGQDNWKTCIWKRASKIGVKCELEYTYLHGKDTWIFHKNECDPSIDRNAIDGSKGYSTGDKNHLCQLRFTEAKFSHEDKWTCILESCNLPKNGGCKTANGSGFIAEETIDVKVIP